MVSAILIATPLVWGALRSSDRSFDKATMVGLVVLDEKTHQLDQVNFQAEIQLVKKYAVKIADLGRQGAKLVVLPERAVTDAFDGLEKSLIGNISMEGNATLYTRLGDWFGITVSVLAMIFISLTIADARLRTRKASAKE